MPIPHILVTNDDGVTAPGLLALAQALRPLGRVTIVAPDRNWSASGHVKTLHKPLRSTEVRLADGTTALATSGAPSDCVALALLGLVDAPIDLVVSGINPTVNVGHDVTYSGTVTAAMEAAVADVPGIAVSLDAPGVEAGSDAPPGTAIDFGPAAAIAARIAERVLTHGLPPKTLLNVNVPGLPADDIQGIAITRQGLRVYRDALITRADPRGRPYHWIGGDAPTGVPEDGTDVGALAAGWVSVTPLQLDMTAHGFLGALEGWGW
ncbi:MAG: 5'/3'-nucleotidase SurE [Ardenticatenales bacterium]